MSLTNLKNSATTYQNGGFYSSPHPLIVISQSLSVAARNSGRSGVYAGSGTHENR